MDSTRHPPAVSPRWALLLLLCLLLSACGPSREARQRFADRHPTREIAYWGKAWQRQPLRKRVHPAPAVLLEKITVENRLMAFSERPVPMEGDPLFGRVLERAEALLPEGLRRLAGERIVGLYLVRHLGSTGYTEAIRNEAGQETYAVIVLDGDLIRQRRANAWATWRERSFFKESRECRIHLTVRLETDPDDTVESAALQILLHELGHALGMASRVHPSWNEPPAVSNASPFLQFSWQGQGETFTSRHDRTLPQRRHLRLYAFETSRLPMAEAAGIYRRLLGTDFSTLYAAVSPWEDFAESFANYLHAVRLGKPYEVRIHEEGLPDAVHTSCWGEERCRAKRAFLESWLRSPLP